MRILTTANAPRAPRRRALATVIALMAAASLLAGCASPGDPQPPSGDAPDPGATDATPTAVPVDGPVPLIDLTCADLLPEADLAAAYDPAPTERPITFEGSGGYYPLSQHGLALAGALVCEYSDGGASDSEHYAEIAVLPDAADDWASLVADIGIFQPQQPAYGDEARQACRGDGYLSCRIDVLVGDRWISAVLGGLVSTDAAGPLMSAVVAAVAAAGPIEPTWSTDAVAPASCDDLASVEVLGEAMGEPLITLDRFAAPSQPVIYHGGFVAAGGMLCGWANDFSSAVAKTVDVSLLPGGAWAWDGYWAQPASDRITREQISGLGDDAWVGCTGDQVCWATVRVGDDWLDVMVNDESSLDETDVAIAIAETIVPRL